MNNSFEKAVLRHLVYQTPDDNDRYYATTLEMNLTVSAKDPRAAMAALDEQTHEYLTSAQENDAPDLLNQEVDKTLEQVWKRYLKKGIPDAVITTASTSKARVTENREEGDIRYRPITANVTYLPAYKWTPDQIKAYLSAALQ